MKRYLSLALALILALSVLGAVPLFADDSEVDVNKVPTCSHLIEEVDICYGVWNVIDCGTMIRTVERTYMCVICSYTYKTYSQESKEGKHTWIPNNDSDCVLYKFKCARCGTKR